MIEIDRKIDHDGIVETIKECFENKHIEIEKESRKYALELSKIKSFK